MAPGLVDSSSQKSTCPRHPHAPQSTATESQRHRLMNGLWRWGPATAHRLRLLSGEEMTADDQSTPATGSLATCEAHVRRRLVPGCDHDRVADILARVSRLFSFAVERDWIEANPALRIVKPSDEKSRDRVLSRDELRELWVAPSALARIDPPLLLRNDPGDEHDCDRDRDRDGDRTRA